MMMMMWFLVVTVAALPAVAFHLPGARITKGLVVPGLSAAPGSQQPTTIEELAALVQHEFFEDEQESGGWIC